LLRFFSIWLGILLIDVRSPQQIIESADPVPSVTIALQHNAMLTGFVRTTVILCEKINEEFALFAIDSRVHENFARLFVKIM
jgi:hypothetical protein